MFQKPNSDKGKAQEVAQRIAGAAKKNADAAQQAIGIAAKRLELGNASSATPEGPRGPK